VHFGSSVLFAFVGIIALILAAQQNDQLQAYPLVMLSFVVSIAIVTLVVSMIRRPSASS
jgi:cation:H+ antiporter